MIKKGEKKEYKIKKIISILTAFTLFLVFNYFASALSLFSIKGKVKDWEGIPVSKAIVLIPEIGKSVETDPSGQFEFTQVPPGEYHIEVQKEKYMPYSSKIFELKDKSLTFDVVLMKEIMEETIVTATKTESLLKDVPVATSLITKEEIKAANIETVADAVRWATNVYLISGKGGGGVCKWTRAVASLQGLPSQYTMVLIDGQKVYGCAGRMYDISFYPVEMIERIEIIRGPASTLYGSEAIAGIINVITKSTPEKPTFFASSAGGTYDTYINKLSHGNRLGKFGYFLNYSRNQTDGMNPEMDKLADDTFQATLEYKFSQTAKLSLKPTYHRRKTEVDPIKHEQYMLNSILDLKPDEISNLKARGSLLKMIYFGKEAYTYEAELDYSRLIKNLHMLTLGYQFQKDYYSDWKQFTGKEQITHSFFIQDQIQFKFLTLTLGSRLDEHNWWGTHILPSASMVYRLSDNARLKAMVGMGFRSPKIVQISGSDFKKGRIFLRPNPDLEPEKSLGYQLGAEYEITKNLQTKVYLFRNDLKDMIETYNTGEKKQVGKQKYPVFGFRNIGEAYSQGVETEVRARFTDKLSVNFGYTFLDSEYKETGKTLIYSPGHKLHFGFGFKQPDYGLRIDLKGEYIGKRYEDEVNTRELSEYFLGHIKVSKDISKWLRASVSVNNIFDKKYEETKDVEMPGRTFLVGLSVNFN